MAQSKHETGAVFSIENAWQILLLIQLCVFIHIFLYTQLSMCIDITVVDNVEVLKFEELSIFSW